MRVLQDELPASALNRADRVEPARSSDRAWIESGVLSCFVCRCIYPIHRGVPILLRYPTALARSAHDALPHSLRRELLEGGFGLSGDEAPLGERHVGASFSTEWAGYEYGGTLWTASTTDRVQTFRGECGLRDGDLLGKRFCEIGCGLGILTHEAAAGLGAEAWGMDLSNAVFRAAAQFKSNSQLHFVQASIFAPPFKCQQFDFVYSHGVLHHTWSTKQAVGRAASLLRPDGTLYVWLYGFDDVRISFARQVAYAIEEVTRPLIARLPGPMATLALVPTIPAYVLASYMGLRSGTHGRTYSPSQALHAARDRFTPRFAHRHQFGEVAGWYRDNGLQSIHRVRGDEVPPTWSLAIERNVAIRGHR
jgi:2-polyprenyl-3-methyl-5-hydroxy-6-metoxy-1,4-benzoquinol methylase